ncbi:MAG: hypothetical protein GY943_31940, partial [Chloroflexi bacterium]|nr:hypothetical protein [Chloroflexota bacterium]
REFPKIDFVGAWGDVFVRDEFKLERRRRLLQSNARIDSLYEDLFGALDGAYQRSALVQLIQQYKPNVIVDCINTATAISYQDIESLSKKTYDILLKLKQIVDHEDLAALDALGRALTQNVNTLLISQSIPQLIRHVQMAHRVMCEVGTRLYLKIGTTGTGGMGLNIPYTHSEDRPSAKLMSKTAVAFAHTGLMFLMARTPGGPLVKELKPGAMIGYRQVSYRSIKMRGLPQFRYASHENSLLNGNGRLLLRGDENQYQRLSKLHMAGVDTGENGFFARGEFEAITHINQMEFITPEEIAQQAVLEIKGSNTGYDVIAGIDSSILNPSFRAGVLRQTALDKLARIEEETNSHSVAIGQLGPPELSKLLYEAYLLKRIYRTLENVLEASATEISESLYEYIIEEELLRTQITSIGLPILAPNGSTLIRGPRINIPESIYHDVEIDADNLNMWADKGWVDLRATNWQTWQARFKRMRRTQHRLHTRGTSSVTMQTYLPETIEIGSVVAWLFNNDAKGYRIK